MNNIKYFENYSNDFSKFFDLYEEDILDHFIDIYDLGFSIFINTSNKLIQKENKKSEFIFYKIPYISVSINKKALTTNDLNDLYKSDLFKESIEVANKRLGDKELYINLSDIKINEYSISGINIYRNVDKDIL